jgi:hypothetical protein
MTLSSHIFFVVFAGLVGVSLGAPVLPRYPSVFEISTRPWLHALSAQYGRRITTLRDIPLAEFSALRARGVDIVWLMGVWHLGPYGLRHDREDTAALAHYRSLLPDFTIEDVIGSPYAPTNYTCNPELGTDTDIAWLRDRLHELGLLLMLDFVPNHSACDSPWMDGAAPAGVELYVRAPKGQAPPYDPAKYMSNGAAYGSCPGSSPWTDVAQLNYWNPATRKLMTEQLIRVATLADAVRCDMAYIVLNDLFQQTWATQLASWGWQKPAREFWADAIPAARKANPSVRFLAEVYGESNVLALHALGFDWCYDKDLLDRLKSGNLDNTRGWVAWSGSFAAKLARFTENHDEDRAVAVFGSVTRSNAAALATYTLPGLRFYFQGQWSGFANKLDVHLRRAKAESGSAQTIELYNRLLPILNQPVFRDGAYTYLTLKGDDSWRLMGWRWSGSNQKRLVVVNFSDVRAGCQVVVSDVAGSGTITIAELLSGEKYDRSADEMRGTGLTVVIDAWSAQIFSYP